MMNNNKTERRAEFLNSFKGLQKKFDDSLKAAEEDETRFKNECQRFQSNVDKQLSTAKNKLAENNPLSKQLLAFSDVIKSTNKDWRNRINLLNELVDEKAHDEGRQVEFDEYNRIGMAGSLYSITECFALAVDSDDPSNEPPKSTKRTITAQADDCLVICTDGIHDLVPSNEWALIDNQTDLQEWLQALRQQVYDSNGNAYDNGTAIVVRFE